MHEAPARLKHAFEWFGIEPKDTPERASCLTSQCIYFIQSGEYVKIGVARTGQAQQRMGVLQIGNPVELRVLKTFDGYLDAPAVERDLHNRLAQYHVRGEWFKLPPALLSKVMKSVCIEQLYE